MNEILLRDIQSMVETTSYDLAVINTPGAVVSYPLGDDDGVFDRIKAEMSERNVIDAFVINDCLEINSAQNTTSEYVRITRILPDGKIEACRMYYTGNRATVQAHYGGPVGDPDVTEDEIAYVTEVREAVGL